MCPCMSMMGQVLERPFFKYSWAIGEGFIRGIPPREDGTDSPTRSLDAQLRRFPLAPKPAWPPRSHYPETPNRRLTSKRSIACRTPRLRRPQGNLKFQKSDLETFR